MKIFGLFSRIFALIYLTSTQGWEKSIVIDIRLRYSLLFFNRIHQILYFLEWVSNMLFSLVFFQVKTIFDFFFQSSQIAAKRKKFAIQFNVSKLISGE